MPTKKRQPKNSALAKGVKERLEELRKPGGGPDDETTMTFSRFALEAGIPRSVYNAWRNSGRVPGGFYLRQVAKSFGVTVDWLLCVRGAPKYRDQWRDDATLEIDLSAAVERALSRSHPPAVPGTEEPYGWVASGPDMLRAAVDTATAAAGKAITWERDRLAALKEMGELSNAAGQLLRHRKPSKSETNAAGRLLRIVTRIQKSHALSSPFPEERPPVLLVPLSILQRP